MQVFRSHITPPGPLVQSGVSGLPPKAPANKVDRFEAPARWATKRALLSVTELFDEQLTGDSQIAEAIEDKLLTLARTSGYVTPDDRSQLKATIAAMPDEAGFVAMVKRGLDLDRKSQLLKALEQFEPAELNKALQKSLAAESGHSRAACLVRLGAGIYGRPLKGKAIRLALVASQTQNDDLWLAWCNHPASNLNERCRWNQTPLLIAVLQGRLDRVCHLLEKKADPNLPDPLGLTPLSFAVSQKHYAMLGPLVRAGGRPAAKSNLGDCAFSYLDPTSRQILHREYTAALLRRKSLCDFGVQDLTLWQLATSEPSDEPLTERDVSMAGAFLQGAPKTREQSVAALLSSKFCEMAGRKLSSEQAERIVGVIVSGLSSDDAEFADALN